MKRWLCVLCSAWLLTGCTDIRERLLPDLLAVDVGEAFRFAAHATQEDSVIFASARTAMEFADAMQNASGAEVSTGHLTMLAISGDPCTVTENYLQEQILAPTCMVLAVPRNACSMLERGVLPDPSELQAAVDTGMLPYRTADTVIGDLWGGSGITALHTYLNGRLTLSLWDAEQQYAEALSAEACRGLALFGTRWDSFVFDAGDGTFRLSKADLYIRLSRQQEDLQIKVCGRISAEPKLSEAAADRLREMLSAALDETAGAYGADLLFLRETAIRDGIAGAADCTQEAWRTMLQGAGCEIAVSFGG